MVTVPTAVAVKVAVPSPLSTTVAEPVPPVIVQVCIIGKSGLDGLPFSKALPFRHTAEGPVIDTVGFADTVTDIGKSVSQLVPFRILNVPVYTPGKSPIGSVIEIGLPGNGVYATSGMPLKKSMAYSSACIAGNAGRE